MPIHDILSAGMIRSGSTLVYQILRAMTSSRTVFKTHDFIPGEDYNVCVCTYRHPVDAAISLARVTVDGDDIPDGTIESAAFRMGECLKILRQYRDEGKALLLKYELFVQDSTYLFDALDEHMGLSTPEDVRRAIAADTSIEKNSEIAARVGTYKLLDPESMIHGKHICTPIPGDARRLVRPEMVFYLESAFKDDDLKLFGYPL